MGKKKKDRMPTSAELLAELATLDSVEAEIPTATEHVAGIVPSWCELLLKIQRVDDGSLKPAWPLNAVLPLRRHDGELIIEVLNEVLHPDQTTVAGEAMWAALDEVVERIMKRRNKGKDPHPDDLGEARGIALAIAIVNNPMQPEPDDVRWAATERWNIRNGRN
jgi:hypothetical protein